MKKIFKHTLAMLLAMVMVFSSASLLGFSGIELLKPNLFIAKANAVVIDNGTCGDNLTWSLDTNTGTFVVSGTGDMKDYYSFNLPWSSVKSYIKTVEISEGVTSIGTYAFYGCSNLTNVTIGSNVKTIGGAAFFNCSKLESIMIPNGTKEIGYSAFSSCDNLLSIVIPDSVTTIGCGAFNYTQYYETSSNWENGVLFIGNKLITADCNIVTGEYNIAEDIRVVAVGAFYGCKSLAQINVDSNNKYYMNDKYGVLFNKNRTTLLCCPSGIKSESYTLPSETTVIEDYAVNNCDNIKQIYLNENIRKIGQYAFASCDSLVEVNIKNNNQTISFGSTQANGLTPDDYDYHTDIESFAFSDCPNLKSVVLPDGIVSVGSFAFNDDDNLESIRLPSDIKILEDSVFDGCGKLSQIVIPNGATTIGYYVFRGCESLKYVHIPASVNDIKKGALIDTSAYICSDTEECYAKAYADENDLIFKMCIGHENNCDCSCHSNGFIGILFRIILFFQRLFGTNKICACGIAHY